MYLSNQADYSMESPLYDSPYIPNKFSKKKERLVKVKSQSERDNPEGVSMHLSSQPQAALTLPSSGRKKTPEKKRDCSFSLPVAFSPVETCAPPTTPVTSTKKRKKHHNHFEAEDSQIFINPEYSVYSMGSRDPGLSDSEIDVDASSLITPPDLDVKSKPMRTPSPSKSPKCKIPSAGNTIWEKIVKEARGSPDGAGDSTLKIQAEEQLQNTPAEKVVKKVKVSPYEKKKKKPYAMLEKATSKIKKIAQCTQVQGRKRKQDLSPESGKGQHDQSWKNRKKQRKMQKNNYELSLRAKQIWEDLRKAGVTPEERPKLCTELYSLVKGNTHQLIFAHDTSRVVQCLYKNGLPNHQMEIFEELRENIIEMAKSKYAKFFLLKLMKYGTKNQRNYLFRKLHGNVRKLIRHKEASVIIEVAYNNYANAAQRAALIEEFYGPSYALFKTSGMRTLEQIVQSHPERRDSILSNMREALSVLADRAALRHTIVHRVFLEYFTYASDKAKADMIESVREGVVEMLHTRDGARVAMMCLWHGNTKDRKVIVKSFKSYVARICKEEYGHLVMLAVFDTVDDTRLVQKALLSELNQAIPDLADDQYGRKVLIYLLAPRDPTYFHPEIVKILKQGDNNPHSKKDSEVRRQELLEFVSRQLVQFVSSNCRKLATDNSGLLLLIYIITHVRGDPTDAMRAVAELAGQPFIDDAKNSESHLVEHPVGHITLKRLVVNDAARMNAGQTVFFSCILMDIIPEGALRSWVSCNRGCFLLVSLLELGHDDVTLRVERELTGMKPTLKKLHFKGAQLLLSKL